MEIQSPLGFTKFQSVANEQWFLGFRKNGKRLKGYQWTRPERRKCFQFIKTDFHYIDPVERPTLQEWGPQWNFRPLRTHLFTQNPDKT